MNNYEKRLFVNYFDKMLDDLNTYIVYKFSDIYEDNVLAYITFLKRYQIAMKLLDIIVTENRKESLSKKWQLNT